MRAEDWDYLRDNSEYYLYNPSMIAKKTFLYPIQCGLFYYTAGYQLERESFDSFLLLYVAEGTLLLRYDGEEYTIPKGHFMFIDCYKPHGYETLSDCDCLWMHFDGIMARPFYEQVTRRLGYFFSPKGTYQAFLKLQNLFVTFSNKEIIREPLLSKLIHDIMTIFLLTSSTDTSGGNQVNMCEEVISFINEHFAEEITNEDLAARVGLSPYHFIRAFKKGTGYTPHEYLIGARMSSAKFLLTSTDMPIKNICYSTGFSSESVFCSSFKHTEGISPAQYRKKHTVLS